MAQKKSFHLYKEAKRLGSYDEYPMVPAETDMQLHLSRNTEPQPFYLICDGDTVHTQMSGKGSIQFNSDTVKRYPLARGDVIYIPAGTPHRFIPTEESIVMRAKAQFPKLEGVAWCCERCGAEVQRHVWNAREKLCQEGYLEACTAFNADEAARRCPSCGEAHETVDIGWNRWAKLAGELRENGVSPDPLQQARHEVEA